MLTTLVSNYDLLIALVAASALAGFAAGLFGIGGGAIIVPVLYLLYTRMGYTDYAMHVALATSLATIIVTSISSVRAHHRKEKVDWAILKQWAPALAVGAAAGQLTATSLPLNQLIIIFASLGILLSLQLFFGSPNWSFTKRMPRGMVRTSLASLIGYSSTLMGVGGGTYGVTVMTLCGRNMHQAIGTASGFGFFIAIPSVFIAILSGAGLSGRPPFSAGYVDVAAFVLISGITYMLAPVGALLAHQLPARFLKKAFALLLVLIVAQMLGSVTF